MQYNKIPATYQQSDSKFMGRSKRPRRANTILKDKKKVGGLLSCYFKTYQKATVLKEYVRYWQTNRQIDRWGRTESSESNPHKHNQ